GARKISQVSRGAMAIMLNPQRMRPRKFGLLGVGDDEGAAGGGEGGDGGADEADEQAGRPGDLADGVLGAFG
ncbi:hypothetical protein AB0K48_54920, partial [Nonomuraea sp. NPDC055795]